MVLRVTNTPPPHLIGRWITDLQYAVYGSRELVERIGADAPYQAFPWLHLDARSNPRHIDAWLARNAPGARIAMRLDNTTSIRQAIRAGIGVQLLACYDGEREPGLTRIGPPQEDSFGLWLLTLPELRTTSRVRVFMEHMVEALQTSFAAPTD